MRHPRIFAKCQVLINKPAVAAKWPCGPLRKGGFPAGHSRAWLACGHVPLPATGASGGECDGATLGDGPELTAGPSILSLALDRLRASFKGGWMGKLDGRGSI